MADFGDIAIGALGTGGTTALVVAFARKWWSDREAEREEARVQLKAIKEAENKELLAEMKELGSGQKRLEDAMRDVTAKTDTQAGAIREVKTRVNKGFKFHRREHEKLGARVARMELEIESMQKGRKK